MDQSLVHAFSWGNSYGPMVLKVLLKFPPTLVLVHGWLFPEPSKLVMSFTAPAVEDGQAMVSLQEASPGEIQNGTGGRGTGQKLS